MNGSIAVWSAWCWASHPSHSAWTAARNVAMDRFATVTLSDDRFVRSVASQVFAISS